MWEQSKYRIMQCQACLGKVNTDEQKDAAEKVGSEIWLAHYSLDGNLEELIKKSHRQVLAVMARAITEDEENKHLNLKNDELLKGFIEKYKITNIG
jgi:hypothetical protein